MSSGRLPRGAATLPFERLFEGIAAIPEYWWLFALLLSIMISSLVNLGTS
jgi:hypothetical protein